MKSLTILVPNGDNNLSSIVGPYKLFSRANELWAQEHGEALFRIQLAGLTDEVRYYDGLFAVKPQVMVSAVNHADLIIIPSLNHKYDLAMAQNEPIILWLAKQHRQGAAISSICTGAFLLAAAGLLDGHSCSTHWAAAADFSARFPQVHLQPDLLITDENGLYTNGGAYSFLNLMIYLIEKYFDRQMAIRCSKIFQIEIDRNTQSVFSIFTGQKRHGDEMIIEAQEYIEGQLHSKISVEDLSSRFAVSRRNFDRRFIKATGNTPLEYAQRVKMESAKKALENTRKNVNEVMYEVGYSDPKAFREVFRKVTGLSPQDYKTRYSAF